jgi:hypothetical protein
MCANHSTIGAIIEDCGNFEIPTRCLTNNRSASELTIQLSVSPNSHLILTYLNFASFKVSATYVDPAGIEPAPPVLQTSVRTSYTKGPRLIQWAAEDSNLSRKDLIYSQAAVSKTTFATQLN